MIKKLLRRLLRGKRDGERKPLLPRLILPLCILAIFAGGLGIGVAWSTPQTSVDWAHGYAVWAREHPDEGYEYLSDLREGKYVYINSGVRGVAGTLYGSNYMIFTYTQTRGLLIVQFVGRRVNEEGVDVFELVAMTWAYNPREDRWMAVDLVLVDAIPAQ